MSESNPPKPNGVSLRSRPNIDRFLPIMKFIDSMNAAAADIDVDMAMGENWLVREPLVAIYKKAMAEEFDAKHLSYQGGMGGSSSLLSAFSAFFNQFFLPRIPIIPEHVITVAGASTCLDSLLHVLCEDGDSIIAPSPSWGGYERFAQFRANVNIIPTAAISLQSALSVDTVTAVKDAYSSALDPTRIKALLMTNPGNPIGRCLPPSALRELMKFCKEKGLHYISDEVFALSAFGKDGMDIFTSALALVDDGEGSPMDPGSVHVIYSLSKDFGSAGLRMGFIISPRNRPVLECAMMANYAQISVLNGLLATALFKSPDLPSIIASFKSSLAHNYTVVTQALDDWGIEYIPINAGFHVIAKLAKTAQTAQDVWAVLKQAMDTGVMLAPGPMDGVTDGQLGWIRISISIPEEKLREGMRRFEKTLGLEVHGKAD